MTALLSAWGHRRWRQLLSASLDQQLSPAEAQHLKEHLGSCARCHRELEELRATIELLRRMPQPALPRSFALTGKPSVARRAGALGWRAAVQAAATVAVVALGLAILGDALGTLPGDPRGLALTRQPSTPELRLTGAREGAEREDAKIAVAAPPEEGKGAAPLETPAPVTAPKGAEPTSRYPLYLESALLGLALLLLAAAIGLRRRGHRFAG